MRLGDRLLAAVERKTLEDYVHSIVDGSLPFALSELAALPSAIVVVEGRSRKLAEDFAHRFLAAAVAEQAA